MLSGNRRGGLMAIVLAAVVVWCGGVALAADTAGAAPKEVLKKGDRLAIVGDSITEQKIYSRYMEDYLTVCTPQLELWIIQLGWGGETARGFLQRMDTDFLSFKPTVATTCYGMNDGGYRAYDANTIGASYADAMKTLVAKAREAGVTVVIGTPGAVDSDSFRHDSNAAAVYNENLFQLGQLDRALAAETGMPFADVHDPLMKTMAAAKAAYGREYQVCGGDGVHPANNGHVVMAYAFLKALGMDGQIGTITVDMAGGTATASDGHKILSSADGKVEIESTRYPFCFLGDGNTPNNPRTILPFVPFNDDLNRLTLVVKGLKGDKAAVAWGSASKTFTKEQLAKGINLAAEFLDNPFCPAFKKIDALVAAKQNFETAMVKGCYHDMGIFKQCVGNDPEALAAYKLIESKLAPHQESLRSAVRAAVEPVKHTITITPE